MDENHSLMATVRRFEDLEIWKLGREIYQEVSIIAAELKRKHEYRLAEQMKAAAGSVMDNIAEGFGRNSRLEFLNSLSIAKGECCELMSQYYRCLDDKYIEEERFQRLYAKTDIEINKIGSFVAYLNKSSIKGLKFKGR